MVEAEQQCKDPSVPDAQGKGVNIMLKIKYFHIKYNSL